MEVGTIVDCWNRNRNDERLAPFSQKDTVYTQSSSFYHSFFSGDALAAPTHWYYGGFPQVQGDYGPSGITDYTKPKKELRGSILNKSDVNGGGRSSSSSGGLSGLFGKKVEEMTIIGDVINHGKKKYWDKSKSIHYHATLKKGENTLEASLARVLMRQIVANDGEFDADKFQDAYIQFMTTPGSHNDTYASTCHRMYFFNHHFRQLPPKDCPDNDGHNVDTIDGLILPTIAAMAAASKSSATVQDVETVATQCAAVTRKSSRLEEDSRVWSQLVFSSVREEDDNAFGRQLNECAQSLHLPRLPRADGRDQMTACYLSQSLPPLFDMMAKYIPRNDVWGALISNANVGGENVHRGSILGAILGARAGYQALPSQLVNGLHDKKELESEIEAFIDAVLKDN